ncbi:sigma-54-dependent Fis family transcriptional regulator [candidate division KSB1 bacterium]|nr:sigma-54-dependent Fis family transcriptional regulator [candidate division KSB1 bacterium]
MKRKILVIEPDDSIIVEYKKLFEKDPIEIIGVSKLPEGLSFLKSNLPFDGVIMDNDFVSRVGLDVIQRIREEKPHLAMMVTGDVTTEKLVEYAKMGIDDFIKNPASNLAVLKNATIRLFESKQKELSDTNVIHFIPVFFETNRLVGQSDVMIGLKKQVRKIAPLDSTVLITGETGTGKEIVARMIHSLSPQKHNNFLAVHCGGIPDTLLESTLFGHEKGSFTGAYRTHKGYFEIANNGTIFLDEIGDTTPSFQVKLLRVLQDKQFRHVGGTETLVTNARIIAATNRNLKKMLEEKLFREDLYYRLHVITLNVPPLRERPEDISLLIRHFMQIYTRKHNQLGRYLKPETIEILKNQKWQGNVRELENVIERLVALSDSDWVSPSELPDEYLHANQFELDESMPVLPYSDAKNLFECEYIAKLLKTTHGNVSKAAKLANMPRQNLHLKLKKHNLHVPSNNKSTTTPRKKPTRILSE